MSTDPRPDEAGGRHDDAAPATPDDTTAGPAEQNAGTPGSPAGPATTEEHASVGPLPDPPSDAGSPSDAGPPSDANSPTYAGSPTSAGSPDETWPHSPGPEPAQPAAGVDADSTGDVDDADLRAERARRFGRFGQAGTGASGYDQEHEPVRTTALPAAGGAGAATAYPATDAPMSREPHEGEPEIDESDPFDDWEDPPRSRAQAHWWVVLITLVFTPPAWYLITDGGERWRYAREVAAEAIHFGALIEIAGGLVVLAAVLISARWSSVGPIIVGSLAVLIGGAFLAIPQIVEEFLADYSHIFTQLGQFGQNVYDHLLADGNTGRILAYGVVLIFAGVISHGARRQGRREERRRAAVEAI